MNKKRLKQFIFLLVSHLFLLILFLSVINQNTIPSSTRLIILESLPAEWPNLLKRVPIIIYLFIFALFYSLLLVFYLHVNEKQKYKKITDALRLLNEGQYSAPIFLKMFAEDEPVQISPLIDREFLKLHEKLILISEEAMSAAQEISQMTQESKEEIVEFERKRIARELHDSVSQQLFAAAMLLSAVQLEEQSLPTAMSDQLNLVNSIIGEAQSEMRALLLHLRPVKLEDKSLKQGIENLLEELGAKVPLTIDYAIDDIQLTEVVEDHLFRIVQELLSNVLRHAEANKLEVYFKQTADSYRLRFIDDGKGFDMEQQKDSALGLFNIKERIERLGGHFQLISFPKQGTSVEIRIPLITGRII